MAWHAVGLLQEQRYMCNNDLIKFHIINGISGYYAFTVHIQET